MILERTHHLAPGHQDLIAALRLDAPLPARHLTLRVEPQELVAAEAVAAAGARRLRRMTAKGVQTGAVRFALEFAPVLVRRQRGILVQHVVRDFLPQI